MNPQPQFDQVVAYLRLALTRLRASEIWQDIVLPKDAVLARFQPLFHPDHLPHLTQAELRPFFYFEHNHHWTGLYRQVNRICADMPRLREALLILTDETRPIQTRLDLMGSSIFGMGKGIITAILLIVYPASYGVWNASSEGALKRLLGFWPVFERGESFGQKYASVNAQLRRLAAALKIDLWTLDALWWFLLEEAKKK